MPTGTHVNMVKSSDSGLFQKVYILDSAFYRLRCSQNHTPGSTSLIGVSSRLSH
jgi:hypothetical protein